MSFRSGLPFLCCLGFLSLLSPDPAHASNTDSIRELSTGVEKLEATLSGPVLKTVAVIAIVVGGGMLMFGGELNTIAKTLAQLFLAIGVASGAPSIVSKVFNISGATIDSPHSVTEPDSGVEP